MRPKYVYFNIGPTGAQSSEPTTLLKVDLNQRITLVDKYTQIKIQELLEILVNYHVEGIINQIIQILINNTGQTKHIHFLNIAPGKLVSSIMYTLPNINFDTVKFQAIPLIKSMIQAKFLDSKVTVDPQNTYITVDWTIPSS
jgi:hypothetical protein